MTAILGINAFHADSAACLVIDGELFGGVAEERLGERLKHSPGFPENAIRRLLSDAGLRLRDVTHVALARDAQANYAAKARYVLSRPLPVRRCGRRAPSHATARPQPRRRSRRSAASDAVRRPVSRWSNVEHHLAHIASAYYLSPFDELTAGFSYDASGDFVSLHGGAVRGHADRGPRPRLPAPQPGLLLHGALPVHRLRRVRRGVQGDGAGALWRGRPTPI